jgi:hypothetical protein
VDCERHGEIRLTIVRLPKEEGLPFAAEASARNRGPVPVYVAFRSSPRRACQVAAALAPLELGAAALGDARRDERPIRRHGTAPGGAKLRQDRRGVLPGARDGAHERTVAGPGVPVERPEGGDDRGAERIQMEVADEFPEGRVRCYHDGLIPILKEVPHPVVPPIERPGIAREETPHAAGQRAGPGPDQQVGMIREERPGVDRPGALRRQSGHAGHEVGAVRVVAEERGPLNPPHHDVMEGVGRIEAGLAGHDRAEGTTRRLTLPRPVLRPVLYALSKESPVCSVPRRFRPLLGGYCRPGHLRPIRGGRLRPLIPA